MENDNEKKLEKQPEEVSKSEEVIIIEKKNDNKLKVIIASLSRIIPDGSISEGLINSSVIFLFWLDFHARDAVSYLGAEPSTSIL